MTQISTMLETPKYRNYTLSMRLTPCEHKRLDELSGRLTYSEYAREQLLGDHAVKRRTRNRYPVKDHTELGRLLAWIGASRAPNNLNQIAYAVNSGALDLTPEQEAALFGACQDIQIMKSMLTKALGLYG